MPTQFKLNLIDNNIRSQRNYTWIRNNPKLKAEIVKMIDKWKRANIIKEIPPSQVKVLSPLLLVEKHSVNTTDEKEFRLCINL